jgi:ankyrin repeat protein
MTATQNETTEFNTGGINLFRLMDDTGAAIAFFDRNPELVNTAVQYQTPLMVAAKKGNVDVARALLAKGADPSAKSLYDVTALHCAANPYHDDEVAARGMIRLLVGAGADPNARTWDGATPLHCAAANGAVALAEELAACGAVTLLVDNHGETPAMRVPLDCREWDAGFNDRLNTIARQKLADLAAEAELKRNNLAEPVSLAFLRSLRQGNRLGLRHRPVATARRRHRAADPGKTVNGEKSCGVTEPSLGRQKA